MKYIYLWLGTIMFQMICIAYVQAGSYSVTNEKAYAAVILMTEACLKVFPDKKEQAKNVILAQDFRIKTDPGFAGFSKDSAETKAAITETRLQLDQSLAEMQSNADKLNDYNSKSELERFKKGCDEVFNEGYFGPYFKNVRMIKNLLSSQTILPTNYQENFLSSPYESDFSAWQIAFSYDFIELLYKIENDAGAIKSLLSSNDVAGLKSLFAHSVANSEKGLDFKRMIVSSMFERNQGVLSETALFINFAIGNSYHDGYKKNDLNISTRAVGYGGKFKDDANDIELFYISPEGLHKTPKNELKNLELYNTFKPLNLPKFGIAERNVWPALVFSRGPDNKLLLSGMSQEINKLLQRSYSLQLM